MKASKEKTLETWDDYFKAFLKLLPSVSQSIDQRTIFCDACRIFSLSIRGAVTLDATDKEEIEKAYSRFVGKYQEEGMKKMNIQIIILIIEREVVVI